MTSSLLSGGLLLVGVIALAWVGVTLYALRTKGDVRALFAHGKTVFKLEAKGRDRTH